MKPVFARQPFPDEVESSIFLAGPTPRRADVKSWRPEALEFLKAMEYRGHVFVPETPDGRFEDWANPTGESPEVELPLHEAALRWKRQVEWEEEGLNRADLILFWIPRDMATMPALTTNNEFGNWIVRDPSKVMLGVPQGAPHTSYQLHQARQEFVPVYDDLCQMLSHAAMRLRAPELRKGGECQVPRHLWQNGQFRQWLDSQKFAGNELRGGRVLWTYRVGKEKEHLFCFAYHAQMWVAAEGRVKSNEFVLGRPDVYTVVAHWSPTADPMDAYVVLVREFRTPASTYNGYVWEPPGGSSFKKFIPNVRKHAADELFEETGIKVDQDRLKYVQGVTGRQVAATLSSHRSVLFSLTLTDEEFEHAKKVEASEGAFGVAEDTERTYVRVRSVRHIMNRDPEHGRDVADLDWSALGQIMAALHAR